MVGFFFENFFDFFFKFLKSFFSEKIIGIS